MSRQFKTSQKNRTSYIYYTSEGDRIILTPDEKGVTEANIDLLHEMDDAEVDEQRRSDYRTSSLDAYHDGNGKKADDRNTYLADDSMNPEIIAIEQENVKTRQSQLDTLATAMQCLLPQQIELFKKIYVDRRTNTNIAAEEGVSEAAIRNRLKKINEKLRKYFS